MKKYLILIVLAFVCSSCNYNIKKLPHKSVSYDELPDSVKSVLFARAFTKSAFTTTIVDDTIITINGVYESLLPVNPTDTSIYCLENIEFGPWTIYSKLIDKKKNVSYRIPREEPEPFIIYGKKLYIPNEYNILSGEGIYETMYTEYELK